MIILENIKAKETKLIIQLINIVYQLKKEFKKIEKQTKMIFFYFNLNKNKSIYIDLEIFVIQKIYA